MIYKMLKCNKTYTLIKKITLTSQWQLLPVLSDLKKTVFEKLGRQVKFYTICKSSWWKAVRISRCQSSAFESF